MTSPDGAGIPDKEDVGGWSGDYGPVSILGQLGPKRPEWSDASSVGKNAAGQELTLRDGIAALIRYVKGGQ